MIRSMRARRRVVGALLIWGLMAHLVCVQPEAVAVISSSAPDYEQPCTTFFEPSYSRQDVIYPDTRTWYLGIAFVIPPGGHVEIKGEYPYARYFSLQTATNTTQTIMSLADHQIQPDPGSSNPFVVGARRAAVPRSYTARIVHGSPPADGSVPPNTLYDTSAQGLPGNILAYRVYLPDRSTDEMGGVDAPQLTMVLPGGERTPLPQCPDPIPNTSAIPDALGELGFVSPPVDFFGENPPVFQKRIGFVENWVRELSELPVGGLLDPLGGLLDAVTEVVNQFDLLGASADNAYLYTFLNRSYGKVVVIRGKLPTTPKTYDGNPVMGKGQLRYWSACTGDAVPPYVAWGCAFDEQMPVDAKGYYSLVISTPADRPRKATKECGYAWVPWGPSVRGFVGIRNQLADPAFTQSVQNATVGNEKATMGEYYPSGNYFSSAGAFDVIARCKG